MSEETAPASSRTAGEAGAWSPPRLEPAYARDQTRRYWRLAAVLFIGGGLAAAPSDALHQPQHPPTIYLLPLLAITSGLICLALQRAPLRWLHLMAATATVEIAITVWLADELFAIYYVFIALYAAYVFQSRRAIAFHVLFASVAALAPIAYEPDAARATLIQGLVLIPTMVLAAGAVTTLRERLVASETRYRELAYRDPLTGLANYRMFTDRVPEELDRQRRHQRPLALILIDLDDFKRVNDEHGHRYGDEVLQEVGRTLRDAVRAHDLVMRQGGDEFSVIAPETDRASAAELSARVCAALGGISVGGRPIGGTAGCAVFPDDGDNVDRLLAHADQELLGAKERKSWPGRRQALGERDAALS